MQAGLRSWVARQTGYELGYVEQLYTFADRDRGASPVLEVSYLGLTTLPEVTDGWLNWFEYFPWEDRRSGEDLVAAHLAPALERWTTADPAASERRRLRCAVAFGLGGHAWQPDMALQRYELLYEAGLVPEAHGGSADCAGRPMERHHRRILATAMGRLRSKIQYRPVVFELLPPTFTLSQLQETVEAIAGQHVHTQNFRRLVEQQELVEETGEVNHSTGGRPARLFRFRREVTDERSVAGTKLPVPRAN
jgi:hypothetical protein